MTRPHPDAAGEDFYALLSEKVARDEAEAAAGAWFRPETALPGDRDGDDEVEAIDAQVCRDMRARTAFGTWR